VTIALVAFIESGFMKGGLLWLVPGPAVIRELIRVELPAGATVRFPASAYVLVRQQIWLIEGRLDFGEGDVAHAMGPGDCLALGPPVGLRLPRAGTGTGRLPRCRGEGLATMPRRPGRGHNGGPPLDDYRGPLWGKGDPQKFLRWKRAHKAAWKPTSRDIALFRLEKAEALGLTYEEYTLEILERGRHLCAEDSTRIAEIKAMRRCRSTKHLER
jgi:hypothetical protein